MRFPHGHIFLNFGGKIMSEYVVKEEVRDYALEILEKYGCDLSAYWGVDGDTIIKDLKTEYPNGMKYPFVDVANAIMSVSKPSFIERPPFRMIFDMGHTVDSIPFESFEAAKDDAIETLVDWMCQHSCEHHIESNDIST